MLYRQQIKKNENWLPTRKNFLVILLLATISLTTIIKPDLLASPFRSITLFIVTTKENVFASLNDLVYSFYSKIELAEENRELKKQYETMSKNYSLILENLKLEKEELEKNLGRKTEKTSNAISFVLAKPPVTAYDTIVIDLGKEDNIKENDPVLFGNYLIGFISKVLEKKSIVTLYGSKSEDKTDLIIGDSRLNLKGRGTGLGSYEITQTSETLNLVGKNARILASPNYIFGTIIQSEESSDKKNRLLKVKSPVNIFELSTVDVVIK